MSKAAVTAIPDLISLWDFQEPSGAPRVAQGPHAYALQEMAGPIARVEGGVFGSYALELRHGQYLSSPRADCPALDRCGPDTPVTIVAWLQRQRKREIECEAIAGMWNETQKKRQYALFLDLRIHHSGDNVAGHVSASGGPTPGYPWCMDAAIGASYLTYFDWHCVAFSYDGQLVRAYLDGQLDSRVGFNPFAYPSGLFTAGSDGADFTVGAVHRSGAMGNWFVGRLGGLAVFSRALSTQEIIALSALLPTSPMFSPTTSPMPL